MKEKATSRRQFLKTSGVVLAAAAVGPRVFAPRRAHAEVTARSNTMPGRIVIAHDPLMQGHTPTIDPDAVERLLHEAIRYLTGIEDIGLAFESLLPGIQSDSKIAIKVNCIGPTDTRWETVRAIVSGLNMMLGGSYDISNVTIYDNHSLSSHGYTEENFDFDGNHPVLSSSADCQSGYYVYGGHQLSNHLLNADYIINVPALKSHSNPDNQITTALKNHYGSCCPPSLCGNIPGMLTVNSDVNVKDKTALIVMDGIRGTYNGGPGEPPQVWNTFPEQTPNTLFVSTDPVTNEYWAREYINAERVTHGWSEKPCPWVEEASGDPYNLGVSDPEEMVVIHLDPTAVYDDPSEAVGGTFMAPNVPNPFSDGTLLRFRLESEGAARISIYGPDGRLVRVVAEGYFDRGFNQVPWDGHDTAGQHLPPGTYFATLETARARRTRKVIVAH